MDSLKSFSKKVDSVSGKHSYSIGEMFNDTFMKTNTEFSSIDDFFNQSPFKVENEQDLENIDVSELDVFVKSRTNFSSWDDMKSTAAQEYLVKLLGL